MKKAIYPWLLSTYAVAHPYAVNTQEIRDSEFLWVLLACLLLTSIVYAAAQLVTRNQHKSAMLTTSVLIPFYFIMKLPLFVTLVATFAFLIFAWRASVQKTLEQWTLIFTATLLALLAIPAMQISQHAFYVLSLDVDEVLAVGQRPAPARKLNNSPERPDIYYIVPDGYSSNAHLSREWDYDNSAFTKALEDLGFFVAYDSKSNYGATLHSLSSALNLRYVEENASDGVLADLDYLRILIADNLIARLLMEKGYTYLYMNSGTLFPSTTAEINFDVTGNGLIEERLSDLDPRLDEAQRQQVRSDWFSNHFRQFSMRSFCVYFFKGTILAAVRDRLPTICISKDRPLPWIDTRRFFATQEKAKTIPDMPEATFTLVHLVEPHGPVQFKRNGEKLAHSTWRPTEQQFFDELEFVNEQLLSLIETIIEKSPQPPIIILQADHGTKLGQVWAEDGQLTNFEILNAFHLPGKEHPTALKRDVSPINSFPLLLNAYFDGDHELLEERRFNIPKGYKAPFEQIEVTEPRR